MSTRKSFIGAAANRKGRYSPITGLLLLVFLVLVGIFALSSEQDNKNRPPASARQYVSPSDDWATHVDPDNHFSIRYPPDWKVYERSGLGYSFQSPDLGTGYGGEVEKGAYVRFIFQRETTGSIHPDSPDNIMIDWFKQNFGSSEEAKLLSEPERAEVGGYPAILAERETFLLGKSRIAVVISKDGALIFDCFYNASQPMDAAQIFSQMLDTLQILP
jgi:hypothetical protein